MAVKMFVRTSSEKNSSDGFPIWSSCSLPFQTWFFMGILCPLCLVRVDHRALKIANGFATHIPGKWKEHKITEWQQLCTQVMPGKKSTRERLEKRARPRFRTEKYGNACGASVFMIKKAFGSWGNNRKRDSNSDLLSEKRAKWKVITRRLSRRLPKNEF